MKARKLLQLLLLALGVAAMGSAWADRGHVRFGVTIGPWWGPGYYAQPYYYPGYYPPVVVSQAPTVYVEQQPAQLAEMPAAVPANYWYYCGTAKAYYPYVKDCQGGWQRVSPQPPNQP